VAQGKLAVEGNPETEALESQGIDTKGKVATDLTGQGGEFGGFKPRGQFEEKRKRRGGHKRGHLCKIPLNAKVIKRKGKRELGETRDVRRYW